MFLDFETYRILNEGFNSKIISNLFKEGELDTKNKRELSLFNQVKDNEIIGIAKDEEEAKKMLHDKMGDKKEKRYHSHRVWHQVGEDDWDDDWETDYDSPYVYNKTVEGYMEWIFKLNSGKFLVLKIEKSVLQKRLNDITYNRTGGRKQEYISDTKRKFLARKKYVENNKEDIKKYWEFKKLFQEKSLWKDFVDSLIDELNYMADQIVDDKNFESDVCSAEDGVYCFDDDSIEFEIGEFTIGLYVEGEFDGDVRCWDDPGDYWTPGDSGCELNGGEMIINSLCICVTETETEKELFNFTYLPDFDKKEDLCHVDCSW